MNLVFFNYTGIFEEVVSNDENGSIIACEGTRGDIDKGFEFKIQNPSVFEAFESITEEGDLISLDGVMLWDRKEKKPVFLVKRFFRHGHLATVSKNESRLAISCFLDAYRVNRGRIIAEGKGVKGMPLFLDRSFPEDKFLKSLEEQKSDHIFLSGEVRGHSGEESIFVRSFRM